MSCAGHINAYKQNIASKIGTNSLFFIISELSESTSNKILT